MSVLNTDVVDFIGIDDRDGKVHLTIYDHLPWEDKQRLFTLQKKINAYLGFIETGEMVAKYPDTEGREVIVDVELAFKTDPEGLKFLDRCQEIIRSAGFDFNYTVDIDSEQ